MNGQAREFDVLIVSMAGACELTAPLPCVSPKWGIESCLWLLRQRRKPIEELSCHRWEAPVNIGRPTVEEPLQIPEEPLLPLTQPAPEPRQPAEEPELVPS